MEDVYTIKVKTKPDTRNLYPSERRYSASTVSGLAWVHIALSATSFLLACLALVSPVSNPTYKEESVNLTLNNVENDNSTDLIDDKESNNYILVLAPGLITIFGLCAGIAAILASVRWYIDRNITWLFVASIISTLISFSSFVMIVTWFVTSTHGDITEFYKDQVPFKDFVVIKHSDVIEKNSSHMIVALNSTENEEDSSHLFTKHVLSINILIAAFLELLWSILSIKISYKGMRNNYKDDNNTRRGNCISVVTTIKGNDPKNMPRNPKINTKPDLIEHYPSKKIKRIFLAQNDDGFYLKNENNKKQNTDTSSEFYKERMMNFLNRCASMEMSNTEMRTPSVQSEAILNPIPEITIEKPYNETEGVSWGDTPDHTIYNQNNINFEKIFKFAKSVTPETSENQE
ncbi:uncharacterized protein LOC128681508 [Plodia interpunctella]|uniref:uncharacterized protein LOC128681508 n=1 Tax=Plodia interpunctella TaxID=58824 RepID=UPI0023679A98|nr:uncharacterized protein LOC128681508 [Plodia interpunctella]